MTLKEAPTALILAAGFGKRLQPWTLETPKPLIPVAGVEALFFAIYRISKTPIKKVIINSHYLSEHIEDALKRFSKFFPDLELVGSYEENILGTGGSIFKVVKEHSLKSGLLVLNGDTLSSLPLDKLWASSTSFSVSFNPEYLKRYNPVYVQDKSGLWLGTAPQDDAKAAHFLGAHYLAPDDLLLFKNEEVKEIDLFRGVYQRLTQEGRLPRFISFEIKSDEFWFDLTSKDFLLEAKKELSSGLYPLWKNVVELRHPEKDFQTAIEHWPLKSV